MAAFNSSSAVVYPAVEDAATAAEADSECGSFDEMQNSTSLNAMKFYGQVTCSL